MKILRRKRKRFIKTILLIILTSLITRMLIYYLFHLENHHTLMEMIIHFGVIKCVVIYFPSIPIFGKLLKMECISIAMIIPYLLMSKYIKKPKLLLF
jgi:DNA integrity scanning protein DisA with diadenylate cyclase activity